MTTEQLKELGLTDEQISAVMELKGKVFTSLEEKLTAETKKVESLEEKLTEANKQIEGFADQEDIDAVKTEVQEWKTKYEDEKAQREEDLFQARLDKEIASYGGKNSKLIKAGLDLEAIRGSNNQNEEIAKALKEFKEENDFMFSEEQDPKDGINVVKPQSGGKPGLTQDDFRKMKYSERVKLKTENPQLYEKLIK